MTSDAPPGFSLRQRILLWLIGWLGYFAVRLICSTLRYSVSLEGPGPDPQDIHPKVHVFWHRCIFPAAYYYRNREVVVLASRSFDGEYITRIAQRLGYRIVRGSSSRGGMRALLESHGEIEAGRRVAFTVDGPRGPRYVAKKGPVMLARNMRIPIVAFHIALDRAWVLNSWDAMLIPKPFARALIRVSAPIDVSADADAHTLDACHDAMQAALERVRDAAESMIAAGTSS